MTKALFLAILAIVAVATLSGAQKRLQPAARPSRSVVTHRPVAPRPVATSRKALPKQAVRRQVVVRTVRPYRSYRSYGYDGNYNNNGYGRYGYAPLPRPSGLKFDLELVPEKERKAVKRGKVYIDGLDKGIVGRYDGGFNKALKYPSGTYEIEVRLKDGRTFNTTIEILPEQIAPVYPEFN